MTDRHQLNEDLKGWVYSVDKREELGAILLDTQAGHNERQWLVGFLHHAGATLTEILSLIHEHTQWANYDPAVTKQNARAVVKRSAPQGPGGDGTVPASESIPEDSGGAASERDSYWVHDCGPFDGAFCQGARKCVAEVDAGDDQRVATYRTVEGEDHTLLVIDLDGDKEGDLGEQEALQRTWEAACELWAARDWWLMKFSGARGFHLVDRLEGKHRPEELETQAREVVAEAGVTPTLVDWGIYTRERLIRCVGSLHLGSGLHSVVVDPTMGLEEVLAKAKAAGGDP